MKATQLLPLLLLGAFSCQKPLFTQTPRWMRMQDRYAHMQADSGQAGSGQQPQEGPEEKKPSVYVTALRFPEGVDWRSGSLEGARIVLWKDGEEVLDVPGGHYPEPDRHRVRDGHLWQDDSDGRTTRILRDGEELVRYDGDEILRGMLLVEDDIHTLGQRAGSAGFSYRINGREVYAHPQARVPGSFQDREWEGGALMQDGDGAVYYCCALPIRKSDSVSWEYRLMQGDRVALSIAETEAETVFDIRVWKGSVYRSEQRSADARSLVMVRDSRAYSLTVPPGETVHLCRLVPQGEQMLVKGYSVAAGKKAYTYWMQGESGVLQQCSSEWQLAGLYTDNPLQAAVYLNKGKVQRIWNGEKNVLVIPGRYTLRTQACTAYKDGVLYAALSDYVEDTHLVLRGDVLESVRFNGCFTGIWIE